MCQTEAQRIELRPTVGHAPEYACSKEDSGDMHLETATLAALVHKYKSDGFTTLLSQIRQTFGGVNENVQESILSMLERYAGYVILK
jgi:hypothetical protein